MTVATYFLLAPLAPGAVALIMPGTSSWSSAPGRLDGYLLSVQSHYLSVTALGFYDFEGTGLLSSHDVGFWDASGNLLASIEVPAGTDAYWEDDFRWVDLPTPVLIPPGTYTVAGTNGSDLLASDYTRVMGPDITYLAGAWADSLTLTYPTGSQPVAQLGGNFQYEIVPEPSVSQLIALGALGAWAARRRL